jgi:hypothetical protein
MIKLIRENIFISFFLLLFTSAISAQTLADVKIGIVHSELTKQLLHKHDNNFYPILDWELFFLNQKTSYFVIEDDGLDSYNFGELDVLILPSVEILSEGAIDNLKDFLSDGKSLFIFGELGSYNQQKNVRKTDALEILTGLKTENLPIKDQISEIHSLNSSNFLTQNSHWEKEFLIMNQQIPKFAYEMPSYAKLLGNYLLDNTEEKEKSTYSGIAALEKDNWKVLWFGFQLSQIASNDNEKKFLEEIILNGIKWLAGKPLAWINHFPSFYESATLFSGWVKNLANTINNSALVLEEENVPANFFISPFEIQQSFDELYKLASIGNINLLFDEYDYLNEEPAQIEITLNETSKILKGESRKDYFGIQIINSSELQPSSVNLQNYFDFILTPELKLNELHNENESSSSIKIFPNYINDLIHLNEIENKSLLNRLAKLYAIVSDMGGIVSHIFIQNESKTISKSLAQLLKPTIKYAKIKNSYITTFSDLINWQNSVSSVEVNVEDIWDESKIEVEIKNSGDKIIEQIGLKISIPTNYESLKLISYDFDLNYSINSGYYNLSIPFLLSEQAMTIEFGYIK